MNKLDKILSWPIENKYSESLAIHLIKMAAIPVYCITGGVIVALIGTALMAVINWAMVNMN